jgi:hypothetical protein
VSTEYRGEVAGAAVEVEVIGYVRPASRRVEDGRCRLALDVGVLGDH